MIPKRLARIAALVVLLLGSCMGRTDHIQSGLISSGVQPTGFQRSDRVQPFIFPEDLGAHPDYQTEWWYYTGNLDTPEGGHFGFQLTFFRRALLPAGQRDERDSAFATEQIYFAHFAITDVNGSAFHAFERFARGAGGIAGAQAAPYQVWLENWSVRENEDGSLRLFASEENVTLDLQLTDLKGPIPQGDQGYSRKGPEAGDASYYYSQTRLKAEGIIHIGAVTYSVSGLSWKDHEYSTSALSPGQIGWDWFSIQLDNHVELMLFYLRKADGSVDPYSSGMLIFADGSTQALARDDFSIQALDTWRSPHSGADYPSRWRVSVPSADITLEIEPHLPDQELRVTFVYWEGAVQVRGTMVGEPVRGNGYVELTGYFASMEGEF
jgi:predicted secreted hydrolase